MADCGHYTRAVVLVRVGWWLIPFSGHTLALKVLNLSTRRGSSVMVEHVVASVGRISAGAGYDYLSRDVATSKHDYYVGHGEAPGVWAGRGIGTLGLGGEVDAVDMSNLYGRFVDPRTAGTDNEVILGRAVTARTHSCRDCAGAGVAAGGGVRCDVLAVEVRVGAVGGDG